jgi:hypothetical protein
VADKSSQLVLNALTRAAADAAGVPLHGNKAAPGLFPATALGKQAAQRCREEGYLVAVSPDHDPAAAAPTARTRTPAAPLCTITDKGLDFLIGQVSPRQVLEDFVRVLESRESQVGQLLCLARQMQAGLEALRNRIAPILEQASRPALPARQGTNGDLKGLFEEFHKENHAPDRLTAALLDSLGRWADSGATEDFALPDLFRQVRGVKGEMTIGAFHDALRGMQDAGQIHLQPWTGPLYAIAEPAYALLNGHTVAYYASLRKDEG